VQWKRGRWGPQRAGQVSGCNWQDQRRTIGGRNDEERKAWVTWEIWREKKDRSRHCSRYFGVSALDLHRRSAIIIKLLVTKLINFSEVSVNTLCIETFRVSIELAVLLTRLRCCISTTLTWTKVHPHPVYHSKFVTTLVTTLVKLVSGLAT
jgi:hypothetical protein